MGVKTKHRKKIAGQKAKSVGYYLQLYTVSVISGCLVLFIGTLFMPQTLPCANTSSCPNDLKQTIDNASSGSFQGHTFTPPKIDLAHDMKASTVLGSSTSSAEKHIYVDLSTQKLYAYQGDNQVMETYIASGKWNPTPVGNFHIWEKLRATRMAGGEGADAYDLPNVPYVMYFFQDYGIHGAYWHNNFGHMMSHGCVNMRIVDAHELYDWADGPTANQLGTAVSVCNSFSGPNTCVQNNPIN